MNTYTYLLENHLIYPELPLCVQEGFHDKAFHTHNHDFGELVIVMAGSAVHTVGEKHYRIHEGDVFVINGPLAHGFREAQELHLFNVMYDYHKPLFDKPSLRALAGYQSLFTIGPRLRGKENFKSWANLKGDDRDTAKQIVTSMYREYMDGCEGYREMLMSQLQQLIIHLSRCYSATEDDKQQQLLPLARAIAYMEDNYQCPNILVKDIALKACVGIRQLDRLFNRYMDSPPIQYLTELRLQRAAELLRYQIEKRVSDIAGECGFSDSNYFTRTFKKRFSVSPREYRGGMMGEGKK